MSSPVLELQRMAASGETDIADLLRKSKLVAVKLGLDEFREWVDHELNGYDSGEVPAYRKARATLQAKNPYRGLIPIIIEDPEAASALLDIEIRDPLSNVIYIVVNHTAGSTGPVFPLTTEQTQALMEGQGFAQLPPIRTVSISKLASIIDAVRNTILHWALRLEEQGILGEGIQFNQNEKAIAATSPAINIQNFQGFIGDVSSSCVTQHNQMLVRHGDIESLKKYLQTQGVSDEDLTELEDALKTDPTPPSQDKLGKRVAGWVGKMVGKAATGAWQIGLGTSSQLLTAAIRAYYKF